MPNKCDHPIDKIRKTETNLLSPAEAAAELQLSRSRVLKLCQANRLGFKVGGRYIITRVELDEFKNKPRPAGNPTFGRHSPKCLDNNRES